MFRQFFCKFSKKFTDESWIFVSRFHTQIVANVQLVNETQKLLLFFFAMSDTVMQCSSMCVCVCMMCVIILDGIPSSVRMCVKSALCNPNPDSTSGRAMCPPFRHSCWQDYLFFIPPADQEFHQQLTCHMCIHTHIHYEISVGTIPYSSCVNAVKHSEKICQKWCLCNHRVTSPDLTYFI